jgi:EAL domain-containing protein (putative c-di-GMP-specific phosphodiesterase class I)
MSVNVSAAQFRSPELVEDIARVLQETGLEAGMLTLEITESVLLEEAQANADTLEQLKALGVRLAIDDFGTGYSSLSYLKRLPVDYLKIDRSFVTNLGQDSQDRLLVSGVIYLAHGLGLKVIAEGVEKAEQLAQLQGMGCDMAQGYYFSRPLASEAATLLTSNFEPSLSGIRTDPLSRIDQS